MQCNPHETTDYDQEHEVHDSSNQRENRASRRSLAPLGALPTLIHSPSTDLEASLGAIDDWRPGESSALQDGAFSVFTLQFPLPNGPKEDASSLQHLSQDIDFTAPASTPNSNHVLSTPVMVDQNEVGTPTHAGRSCDDFGEDSRGAAHILPSPARQTQQAQSRHLDDLSMPSKQKRLIHHWITFTSRKIVLIDESHNPCRTMMLPMALKGLISRSEGSNADVAIFHALCAAAAYNLFELTGRSNEEDKVLALYHDNEAVHHLRHNLARADEHRDQSFAMAIMACIAVEAVSGTTQRWRTHVSGGLAYLAQLQSQGLPEAALSTFRQHMVKMAILCGFPVPDHLKAFLDDDSGSSDGLEFTFPYYGVSRSFLRAHDKINVLLTIAPEERTPLQEKELDAFELQLYLDFPGHPSLNPLSAVTNPKHGTVIHHTSMAFYYAGLVFFQRCVRRASAAIVQDLVELGLQELESIDRVGQGALGCLMLWPVLVLGAECDNVDVQQRMRAYFQAQRRLGFRNLVVLEDLVTTVWRARADPNADNVDADWRHVIAQSQYDVFRL